MKVVHARQATISKTTRADRKARYHEADDVRDIGGRGEDVASAMRSITSKGGREGSGDTEARSVPTRKRRWEGNRDWVEMIRRTVACAISAIRAGPASL